MQACIGVVAVTGTPHEPSMPASNAIGAWAADGLVSGKVAVSDLVKFSARIEKSCPVRSMRMACF
jgi:hypothetical protein